MVVSTADSLMYCTLLFLMFCFDLLVLVVVCFLKYKNPEDDDGEIMGISLQKYFKIILIGILYGLVLVTLNLMNAVAQNLSDLTQFAGLIGGLFQIMLAMAWYWTIGIIIWLIYTAYQDSNLYKELMKAYNEAGG